MDQRSFTTEPVASGLAFVPRFFNPTYSASKAAIPLLHQSLRYPLQDTPVGVLQRIAPFLQTELSGLQQASDPRAMPPPAFIGEVTDILRAQPTPDEICVERVLIERESEPSGNYETVFRQSTTRWRAYCVIARRRRKADDVQPTERS